MRRCLILYFLSAAACLADIVVIYDNQFDAYHTQGNFVCPDGVALGVIDDISLIGGPGQAGGILKAFRLAVSAFDHPSYSNPVAVDVEVTFKPEPDSGGQTYGDFIYTLKELDLDIGEIYVMPEPIDVGFAGIDLPGEFYVHMRYLRPGLQSPARYIAPVFSQTAPTPGTSQDAVWIDWNCNHVIAPDDELDFGGAPLLANLALTLYFVEQPCAGDINGDGNTCQDDLGMLLGAYGACQGEPAYLEAANLAPGPVPECNNLEGINQADIGVLLAHYGCGVCP